MTAIVTAPLAGWPALVLNADFRPLSYYPLSIWPWQEAVKAVFLERVEVVALYDQMVRSPSFEMRLPSVIALREFVSQDRPPAFTRFNVFLRDGFACVYCGSEEDLTFDHVVPRSKGGRTSWTNIVAACSPCNLRKGGRTPEQAAMRPVRKPFRPTNFQLQEIGRRFPPHHLHATWMDYLYWDVELEG
jgi:5-methylcytosine-specific restriction endonuclease McrA